MFFCWGWIVLNLFLNSEQKWTSCSYKIDIKKIRVLNTTYSFFMHYIIKSLIFREYKSKAMVAVFITEDFCKVI